MTATPPAYLVIAMEVHDPEAIGRYLAGVVPLVQRYGGEVLTDQAYEVIEGDWHPQFVIVQRWPDAAAYYRFFESEEYQQFKPIRHTAADTSVLLVSGLAEAAAAVRNQLKENM